MSNIIQFPKESFTPAELLEEVAYNKFEQVLVLGITEDGGYLFASSTHEEDKVIHLMEKVKFDILLGAYDHIDG